MKNAGTYVLIFLLLAGGGFLLYMIFQEDIKKATGANSGKKPSMLSTSDRPGANTGKKPSMREPKPAMGDLAVTDRPEANTGKKPAVTVQ